ncbi:unnamed protein product [Bathycoccus prasinos]
MFLEKTQTNFVTAYASGKVIVTEPILQSKYVFSSWSQGIDAQEYSAIVRSIEEVTQKVFREYFLNNCKLFTFNKIASKMHFSGIYPDKMESLGSQIFCVGLCTLQPALVLPGNTPGVKPPGDMSYRSALCNKTKSELNLRKSFGLPEWQMLPKIEGRSWGTCALVGLADTLLNSERGSEIDAHDTVIRLGELPLARFKRFVGTKTDITWIRRRAKMARPGKIDRERASVRMYIGGNNGIKNMSVLHPFGFINQSKMRGGLAHSPHKAIYDMFGVKNWNKNGTGKKKARVASSGFKDALALIFSKYCSRVDIYGFSNNGGGAYYLPRHLMQTQHNCELESWILHFMMEQFPTLNTCVYL